MRAIYFLCTAVFFAALVAAQWSNTDHEIFDIQAALEKDDGPGASFYSLLNLTKSASAADIRKAYRARSMELHPDKHPNNPAATKRFERLGVIIRILRDERKDRYDYFLANGFPRWSGRGYFYARFRPGLGFVIIFLVFITALAQLAIMHLNYRRDQNRLTTLINSAKVLAWGPRYRSIEAGLKSDSLSSMNKNVIVPVEKKVRVPLVGFRIPPLAPRKEGENEKEYWDNDEKTIRKAMAEESSTPPGSRYIDALVVKEDASVLIMEPGSKEWIPLEEEVGAKPSLRKTWPVTLAQSIAGRFNSRGTAGAAVDADDSSNGASSPEQELISASKSGSKKKTKKNK